MLESQALKTPGAGSFAALTSTEHPKQRSKFRSTVPEPQTSPDPKPYPKSQTLKPDPQTLTIATMTQTFATVALTRLVAWKLYPLMKPKQKILADGLVFIQVGSK